MTADDPQLSSEAEFHAELRALLVRAYDSGIDVEGGWDCRNGSEHPDWDLVVTEVEKPPGERTPRKTG